VKPFPTIWYRGNTAMFHVGKDLVCVPLKFGSSDRALHFMPLLYRMWQEYPFTVRHGRLVQRYRKQVGGKRHEIEINPAHQVYAAEASYGRDCIARNRQRQNNRHQSMLEMRRRVAQHQPHHGFERDQVSRAADHHLFMGM